MLIVVSLIAVIIIKRKTINLVIGDKKSVFVTYKGTVCKALQNNGILVDAKDKITPSLNSEIINNSTIVIKRAVNVQVSVDGKTLTIKSADNTVDALLKDEGIILKDKDKVQPLKETKIVKDMKIAIVRVEQKSFDLSSDIPFKIVTKNDSSLENSVKKTVQIGQTGQKTTTTNVVYENGIEVSRNVVKETLVREPIDTIISQGTKVVVKEVTVKKQLGGLAAKVVVPVVITSRGGNSPYSKVIKARATAYAPTKGLSAFTSSGRKAVRDTNGYSTIAVDPSVIPMGSKMFIEGYGLAIAADTGGSIKGTTIDVFFNTLSDANNWAVRNVTVYILK